MRTNFHKTVVYVLVALAPVTVLAQDALKDILSVFNDILDSGIGFIMVLALLGFIVGAIRFIYTAGDDKSRAAGKRMMLWGTIALFLMVSVWGVVEIIKETFFGAV